MFRDFFEKSHPVQWHTPFTILGEYPPPPPPNATCSSYHLAHITVKEGGREGGQTTPVETIIGQVHWRLFLHDSFVQVGELFICPLLNQKDDVEIAAICQVTCPHLIYQM